MITPAPRAQSPFDVQMQAALDAWLAERGPVEGVTGVAAYISFGPDAGDPPIGRDTLFHMGSTSKSFTGVVILKLEEAGRLTLDDPLGNWLPEYPAWADVSIRRRLNMTCGIPNYSETEALSRAWVEDPARDFLRRIPGQGLRADLERAADRARHPAARSQARATPTPGCARSFPTASPRPRSRRLSKSTATGEPIDDVTPEDPRGSALGLSKAILGLYGGVWFYQGTTLCHQTLYV